MFTYSITLCWTPLANTFDVVTIKLKTKILLIIVLDRVCKHLLTTIYERQVDD